MLDDLTSAENANEDRVTPSSADIRALLDHWSAAAQAKDIDGLMALYAPDITYFDVIPPLDYTGFDAVRGNFLRWFDAWSSSIAIEISSLKIVTSGEIAIAHMLIRTSGTLKNRLEVGYWVRATLCCQRSDTRCWIMHEHISLPVDPVSRTAVMDLVPS
jgi:ketosteroid isomerase-like protein